MTFTLRITLSLGVSNATHNAAVEVARLWPSPNPRRYLDLAGDTVGNRETDDLADCKYKTAEGSVVQRLVTIGFSSRFARI